MSLEKKVEVKATRYEVAPPKKETVSLNRAEMALALNGYRTGNCTGEYGSHAKKADDNVVLSLNRPEIDGHLTVTVVIPETFDIEIA